MKPRIGKSYSTGELKKPKLKKDIALCVTPITNFFKECPARKCIQSINSPVKLPRDRTPSPQTSTLLSPLSRSPLHKKHKRRQNLTPVKLQFEFDFIKIPSSQKKAAIITPVPCPPTPPLSHSSHSPSPSTPKSPASHQSFPSSTQAPLFSLIKTPSPETQEAIDIYPSRETPLVPKGFSLKQNLKLEFTQRGEHSEEIIIISSDSEVESDHRSRKSRKLNAERGNKADVIVIDSSESPSPKKRKTCIKRSPPRSASTNFRVSVSPSTAASISKPSSGAPNHLIQPKEQVVSSPHTRVANAPVSRPLSLPVSNATSHFSHSKKQNQSTGFQSVKNCLKESKQTNSCSHAQGKLQHASMDVQVTKPATMNIQDSLTNTTPAICKHSSTEHQPASTPSPKKQLLNSKTTLSGTIPSKITPETTKAATGSSNVDKLKHRERLKEVETLLWKRGAPYLTTSVADLATCKVSLFNAAQRTVVDTHLDSDCRFLSDILSSLVGYLATVTSPASMPRGVDLSKLFLYTCDSTGSTQCVHPHVRNACVNYFHQLLVVHPPGQHRMVDQQYQMFLTALVEEGESYSLWELLQKLSRCTGPYSRLLSFLVDLLLSDYWACLHTNSGATPLFLRVFWRAKASPHVNSPVRELLKELSTLLKNSTVCTDKLLRLDSMTTLLYLCYTAAPDLSTELIAQCRSLPASCVHRLLGRVHSSSLRSSVVQGLVEVGKDFIKTDNLLIKCLSHLCVNNKDKEISTISQTIAHFRPGDEIKPTSNLHHHSPASHQPVVPEKPRVSPLIPNKLVNKKLSPVETTCSWEKVSYGKDKFPCIRRPSQSPDELKKDCPHTLKFSTAKSCENCKDRTCLRCVKLRNT